MDVLTEISVVIAITVIIVGIIRILKQPLIIGYIISGVIAGPHFLNIIVSSHSLLGMLSHLGIALLLFIVGLGLSPKVIRDVGRVSFIAGTGQVLITTFIGFYISILLGFSQVESIYIAFALSFSSTIIVIKLLSDKRDISALYGKISVGILIVQDIIAMLILMALPSMHTDSFSWLSSTVLGGFGILSVLYLFGRYILPPFVKSIAKSQEYLLLFSMGWCLVLSSVFNYLNFSMEIGALLAGITLSMSPYRFEISSRMRTLRDFFIILFFIILGSQIQLSYVSNNLYSILLLSLFVLIANPLIVMVLMGILGYTKRNSFLTGLTLAQISEFSFILISLGVTLGNLSNKIISIVTMIGLITITGSTYFLIYSNKLYNLISKQLKIFERRGSKVDDHKYHEHNMHDIILFGYNRLGFNLLESFKKLKKSYLVVDFDPEVVIELAKEGVDCRYGDASDIELLDDLNLSGAKMIFSTIPDFDTNIVLIRKIKQLNKKSIILVVSHQIDEALELYKRGATYVIMPHFLGGQYASTLIEKHKLNFSKFVKENSVHKKDLKIRKKKGHEHPVHEHRF